MDQNTTENQTVDNDLQKAIDNITNNTSVDPVFSDPVAAPSSIPEGDNGELDEPVGPFTEPPKIEVSAPAPEPIAPLDAAADIPDLPMPGETPAFSNPFAAPNPENVSAPASAPTPAPAPISTPVLGPAPTTIPISTPATTEAPASTNAHEIKEAALRDLAPLVSSLNVDAEQKFAIYRDIINELKDYSILGSAYDAASKISNDSTRAEALVYLIQSINKM